MAGTKPNPVKRILEVLRFQNKEIGAVYFYAILNGLMQLSLPLGIQSIINFVQGGAISTSIVVLIVLVVTGVFFTGLFQVNQMKLIEKIQQQLFVRYSFLFAHSIPRLNLKSADRYYLPELVNRFFDVVILQKGLAKLLLDIPTATIQILFGLLVLSFYHPVFIFFGLVLILIIYLILRFTSGRGLETSIEESNYKYDTAGWLEELGRVVTSFKFSKGSNLHLGNTDSTVAGYLDARTSHFKILLIQYWSMVGFKVAITAAMLIVGSILLVNQQLNIGQFIAAEIIIITVITSVEKLILNLNNVYDVLTSVEKLSKIPDMPEESSGKLDFGANTGGAAIMVKDLDFAYQENQPVLKDISFEILPGQKVQIMGGNGSGKSSLIRILSGAYQPFDGVVKLDNISIINYSLDSLRGQTGILLSTQELFKGSLLQNITMGNENVTVQDIFQLAEVTGLKTFLDKSPKGLEMEINPTGERLPRKIVQKLLLLRALVNKPRLLLLEEPWLGLEPVYAQQIQDYLLHRIPDCTCLIVSNDIGFPQHCDQVLLLEDGRIRAAGKWEEIQPMV